MSYKIKFSKQAVKDFELIKNSNLLKRVKNLLIIIEENPIKQPYEKLTGNLQGKYSRRINQQHRLVYEVREEENLINIIRMWTHYDNMPK